MDINIAYPIKIEIKQKLYAQYIFILRK